MSKGLNQSVLSAPYLGFADDQDPAPRTYYSFADDLDPPSPHYHVPDARENTQNPYLLLPSPETTEPANNQAPGAKHRDKSTARARRNSGPYPPRETESTLVVDMSALEMTTPSERVSTTGFE